MRGPGQVVQFNEGSLPIAIRMYYYRIVNEGHGPFCLVLDLCEKGGIRENEWNGLSGV